MNVSLTKEQELVLNKLEIFLNTPGGGVFILKGYAGTGKTFLLQTLAKKLASRKLKFTLLAPTGRAAVVLKAKTDFNASTIHSHVYQFSDIDGEADDDISEITSDHFGQMRLLFGLKPSNDKEKNVFIVDEASMVSDEPGDPTSYAHFGSGHLLSDLLQNVGTNKIIFAGDPAQLPPVTQATSPALDSRVLRKLGKVVQEGELHSILRQKEDSGILGLATRVRNIIDCGLYPKWLKLPARGFENVQLRNEPQLLEMYMNEIVVNGSAKSIAICHSNSGCHEISKTVRKKKYGDYYAPLQVGDILMVTQNNYLVPLTNGDFIEILFVGQETIHLGIKFVRVRVKSVHNEKEYEILLCEETLFNNSPNLTSDQQRMLMVDFSLKMRSKGVKPKSDAYYRALESDPYLNSLRVNFGYAVTCHKAQGGEWENVYLFLKKGMYAMGGENLARWWYTAVTRAKERLYIVDDWWIS